MKNKVANAIFEVRIARQSHVVRYKVAFWETVFIWETKSQ